MEINAIKPNDTVYVWEKFGQSIIEGKIGMSSEDKKYGTVYDIKFLYIVDKDGHRHMTFGGNSQRLPKDIYKTPMEVWNMVNDENEKAYQQFLSEINNVYDLIEFPLTHSFGECNDNISVVRAYKEKAKELLGVVIN